MSVLPGVEVSDEEDVAVAALSVVKKLKCGCSMSPRGLPSGMVASTEV